MQHGEAELVGISGELEEVQNDGEKAAMAADTAARVSSSREIESGRGKEKGMRTKAIAWAFSSQIVVESHDWERAYKRGWSRSTQHAVLSHKVAAP